MLTVKQAYVGSDRVLVRNDGMVYRKGAGWTHEPHVSPWYVSNEEFSSWHSVPSGWMDGCPYWAQVSL